MHERGRARRGSTHLLNSHIYYCGAPVRDGPPEDLRFKSGLLKKRAMSTQIHFVNFLTEGSPHDFGDTQGASITRVREIVQSGDRIASVEVYTPQRVLSEFGNDAAWCVQSFPDSAQMTGGSRPNYHKVGMGAWRAFLFNETMKRAAPGDIVFWHDAEDLEAHPETEAALANIVPMADAISALWTMPGTQALSRIYAPLYAKNNSHTKSELYSLFTSEAEFPPQEEGGLELLFVSRQQFAHSRVASARVIVAEKNDFTSKFFEIFAGVCKIRPDLLVSSPTDVGALPCFEFNYAEQSIFNALAWRLGVFSSELPLFNIEFFVLDPLYPEWGRAPDSGFETLSKYLAHHSQQQERPPPPSEEPEAVAVGLAAIPSSGPEENASVEEPHLAAGNSNEAA